jgi:hypothetical protein
MKDQGSTARRQLKRCLNAIDEEYLVILAPLIIRIIAVVQRFFAAAGYAPLDVSLRNRTREAALGIGTSHSAGGLQSPRAG